MLRCGLLGLLVVARDTLGYYTSTNLFTYSGYDDEYGEAFSSTSPFECQGWPQYVGDGDCDEQNNNISCDYDGGDCCFCTCTSTYFFTCGENGYNCTDPGAIDVDDCTPPEEYGTHSQDSLTLGDSTQDDSYRDREANSTFPNCSGVAEYISDGYCDPYNNNLSCGYDGGDCCPCTCVSAEYKCGFNGFHCLDPGGIDVPGCSPSESFYYYSQDDYYQQFVSELGKTRIAEYRDCEASPISWLGDGTCDVDFNVPSCGYDGGDCCLCTCKSTALYGCGYVGYNCTDPDAPSREHFCLSSLGTVPRCEPNLVTSRVVVDASDVSSLVEAMRCSGGTFEVDWSGDLSVDRPIYVPSDTTLYVRGITPDARADGGGMGPIFAVVNASLHVTDLEFVGCSAQTGGAIAATSSNLTLRRTTFSGNRATYGGAIFARDGSHVSFIEDTRFSNNTAELSGGAIFTVNASGTSFSGQTLVVGNKARNYGGAMHIHRTSVASWSGQTMFMNNSAGHGGAVSLWESTKVEFSGNTTFEGNDAAHGNGGALVIGTGCFVKLMGLTGFMENTALDDGGAIYVSGTRSTSATAELHIFGTASYQRNSCGRSGGAIALLEYSTASFATVGVEFVENASGGTGGALSILNVADGLRLEGATFFANAAGMYGGGVYAESSGTKNHAGGYINATVFSNCVFESNHARDEGGAIYSVFGVDRILDSSLIGNFAAQGGALMLNSRDAVVYNCSFIENSSDRSRGPAISRVGNMFRLYRSYFRGNFFLCSAGEFVDSHEAQETTRLESVCSDCGTCEACVVEDEWLVPTCTKVFDHTSSSGGNVTLETLTVDKDYWRVSNASRAILPCFTSGVCNGGTTGSEEFCNGKYEGPYCAVCRRGYAKGIGHRCVNCQERGTGKAIVIIFALVSGLAGVAFVSYMVSRNVGHGRQGLIHRILRHLPLQSLKIVIVVWQIVTQFASAANVTYPHVYEQFLDTVRVINFELEWVLSAACEMNIDFHFRMLITTTVPLIILSCLGVTYAIAFVRNRHSHEALLRVQERHVSMVLWVTILVYSSTSSVVFRMFACDTLDDGSGFHEQYLRSDYRINCNSEKHRAFELYAALMVAVYPVGIPVFYSILLVCNRAALQDGHARSQNVRLKQFSTLWQPYRPNRFYFEVIECLRRMWLAGAVAFIYPNTAAQIAVTIVIALVFAFLCEMLAPYESSLDAWISRTGHAIVFFSMYVALLEKVDISEERGESQNMFAGILVAAHALMIFAVFVEAIALGFWARTSVRPEISTLRIGPLKMDSLADLFENSRGSGRHPRAIEPPVRSVMTS